MKKVLKITLILAFLLAFPAISRAATLNLSMDKDALAIGDEFHATVSIDSGDTGINAAQATLKYDSSLLEATKVDKTNSIFTFWLVEPKYDNKAGEISFVGGATSGFTGKSLNILDVTFKVKGTGTASLIYTDSAVTASDGSGTNVLSSGKGLEFQILTKSEKSQIKPPQISREPEPAKDAPARPKVTIPLYPDPTAWYNLSSDFSATWNLPADVTAVATALNKIPDSAPSEAEGLFDNKNFQGLSNGTWYLHVRFKNNIGWGATNHYRIAIDTVPPLPFKADVGADFASDNPTPEIKFVSKDQFSGIDYYGIKIGSLPEVKTTETSYSPFPLSPGKYTIVVTAHDKAGNASEARVLIDILPISSPDILSVRKDIFVGEGGLSVNGSSSAGSAVIIKLKDGSGNVAYQATIETSEKGFWSSSIDIPLKKGIYTIEAVNQDSRGATSLPAISEKITVKERPILTIDGIAITYTWFIILLILTFTIVFFAGWLLRRVAAHQRERRILIAERDVNSALVNIKSDVEKMLEAHKTNKELDESVETEVNFILKKISDTITKNKGYILENIEDID